MGVLFHTLSTGGGKGASRLSRYIAEREKDPAREGSGPRPLFGEDQEQLTYRQADRLLDPDEGRPEKNDLIHFSVMIKEEVFEKLGSAEKERQARLREAIREGMRGVAEELGVSGLNWVAGIHRNTDNPHVHVVMHKRATERHTGRERRIGRFPKRLLPHKQFANGRETRVVSGRLAERFNTAVEKQETLEREPRD